MIFHERKAGAANRPDVSVTITCGKFTALASWSEVADFLQPLANDDSDRSVTSLVMANPPVITFNKEAW